MQEQNFNLNDIYKEINLFLDKNKYRYYDEENKKRLVELGYKKYLVDKITSINSSILVDETLNIYELVELLSLLVNSEDKHYLSSLIHYLTLTMSNEQKFPIIWEETDNEFYITKPKIVKKDNIINKIVTDKTANYQVIFNSLNNYYLKDFKKEKALTR